MGVPRLVSLGPVVQGLESRCNSFCKSTDVENEVGLGSNLQDNHLALAARNLLT